MPWHQVVWTEIALAKIAANQVTADEVEEVVLRARAVRRSRSSGLPIYIADTKAGRRLVVVFRWLDANHVALEVITAYDPTEE